MLFVSFIAKIQFSLKYYYQNVKLNSIHFILIDILFIYINQINLFRL